MPNHHKQRHSHQRDKVKCNDKHRNCAAKREERNEWLTCQHGRASVLLESVVTESNFSAVESRAEVTLYKPSQAAEVTSRKRAKKPTQRRALQAIVPLIPNTLHYLSKDNWLLNRIIILIYWYESRFLTCSNVGFAKRGT